MIIHDTLYGNMVWVKQFYHAFQRTSHMAILKIITAENPILRQKAKKIHRPDASIQRLIEDMFETMHAANGVGLAAPQIAKSMRRSSKLRARKSAQRDA